MVLAYLLELPVWVEIDLVVVAMERLVSEEVQWKFRCLIGQEVPDLRATVPSLHHLVYHAEFP